MSRCPKCGSYFESGKFKCPNCGSLLVFGGAVSEKPSFLSKLRGYKNIAILIALALLVVALRAAIILTAIYWVFIAGVAVTLLVLWQRGRKKTGPSYRPPQQSGLRGQNDQRDNHLRDNHSRHKRPANVIPFRRKKESETKARQRDN